MYSPEKFGFSPKFRLQPVLRSCDELSCVSALNMSSAAALGITERRCSVLQACKVCPLEASAKAATCGCSPAGACCVARTPFCVAGAAYRIFLRAVQQHADARRGAAAYGDAHLLFGRPKVLISALLFAPFFVAP